MATSHRGSAILLTLAMLILLSLEVAVISLIAVRGLGDEGVLLTQNLVTRRAASTGLHRLEGRLYEYLKTNVPTSVLSTYGSGSPITETLMISNPDGGGSSAMPVDISSWVIARRGNMYQIASRARSGFVDITLKRWVQVQVCGRDITYNIVNSVASPSELNWADNRPFQIMREDGRAFIWEHSASTNASRFWTWSETSGLSVIVSGRTNPGFISAAISPTDGRMFFGEDTASGNFSTWHESTGLSILVSNISSPGAEATVVAPDGRVFFGGYSGRMWTWTQSKGLSTIIPTATYPTVAGPGAGALAVASDGRLYFGEHNNTGTGRFWTWKDNGTGAGVLTLLQNTGVVSRPGGWYSTYVAPDGRVFWGAEANNPMWTWKEGEAVTTLLPSNETYTGSSHSAVVASDGRIYFGQDANPGKLWTWKSGTLTTITSGLTAPGVDNAMAADSTGRVYFGDVGGSGGFRTWKPGYNLSVLISGAGYFGQQGNIAVDNNDRVYVAGNNKTVYTWQEGAGLSVVLTSGNDIAANSIRVRRTDGRMYFGEETGTVTNGNFYTWKNGNGLSVLLSGVASPGRGTVDVTNSGYVFVGEPLTSGRTWVVKQNPCRN